MTELNVPNLLWLGLIATAIGLVSMYVWRTASATARSSAAKFTANRCLTLSRLALAHAVFSFAVAAVAFSLLIMDWADMHGPLGPVVEFLSKFESGLAC